MAAAKNNQRSWKNYLLNKRYQLRFTLFMTGLSALLMGLLGWWVMTQARKATEIAINDVYGSAELKPCERPDFEGLAAHGSEAWGGHSEAASDEGGNEAGLDEPAGREDEQLEAESSGEEDPFAWDDEAGDVEHIDAPRVVLGDIVGEIEQTAAHPEASGETTGAAAIAAYYECRMEQALELAALLGPINRGERTIVVVLVMVGLVLLIGITLYGIVMTHRVAGPLYKISLYLNKLHDGRYDTVYNLRKGDHLVEFYEHFKRAHAGLRTMQEEDLARLREVVDIADREGLASRSPEVAEALETLRALVEEKEKSLV
jgi:hypothetical protein